MAVRCALVRLLGLIAVNEWDHDLFVLFHYSIRVSYIQVSTYVS